MSEYVYVRLKFQIDVHGFMCILYSSIFLALAPGDGCKQHPSPRARINKE
jgi:hypothetical protein